MLLDNRLEWTVDTEALYKEGLGSLYFLRRIWSFGVCGSLVQQFYQSVVAGPIVYAVV